MANKSKSIFVCQSCGFKSPKWLGRCPDCGGWSTFAEEKLAPPEKVRRAVNLEPKSLSQIEVREEGRLKSGLGEFDRVLGGGVVQGSLVLVAGDPGIGKSTLMLQVAERLSRNCGRVLYLSGEESLYQIKLRADRLKVGSPSLYLLAESEIEAVLDSLKEPYPSLLVIDSIQAIASHSLGSLPGTVGQVRECASLLLSFAKWRGVPVFLIGHVTKQGAIAGPKILEHMVDTVLYFEGERHHSFRILRAVKNRFGSTNEVGVFQMAEEGLEEVSNPSQLFLTRRREGVSGVAVVSSMEGTRPLLVEMQALVSPAYYGLPQRVATGFDHKRLSLLLAILEKREGMKLGTKDVFLNVVGGVKLNEPAADLGAAVCVASSYRDTSLISDTVVVGEVGLGGEVRGVGYVEKRIREAQKLGFRRCVVPQANLKDSKKIPGIEVMGVDRLRETLDLLLK